MNCIKLLLISCQNATRWITVRGLSYICHWPLSTSVEPSTVWRPVILLLIWQQRLVMLHTWQLLEQNAKITSWLGDNRAGQSLVEVSVAENVNLAVNGRVLQNPALRSTNQHIRHFWASVLRLHSLRTALQGLSLCEMLREFVAASAELKGLLHLLEHLLVVAEWDSSSLSLNSRP